MDDINITTRPRWFSKTISVAKYHHMDFHHRFPWISECLKWNHRFKRRLPIDSPTSISKSIVYHSHSTKSELIQFIACINPMNIKLLTAPLFFTKTLPNSQWQKNHRHLCQYLRKTAFFSPKSCSFFCQKPTKKLRFWLSNFGFFGNFYFKKKLFMLQLSGRGDPSFKISKKKITDLKWLFFWFPNHPVCCKRILHPWVFSPNTRYYCWIVCFQIKG